MHSASSSRTITAPMGKPFARGFAIVMMSGWQSTAKDEWAQSLPVLYSPHYEISISYLSSKDSNWLYLNLIVNKHCTHFVAPLPQSAEPFLINDEDASLALYRFNNHSARLIRNQALQSLEVIDLPCIEAGNQRRERRLVLRVIGCTKTP